MTLNRYQKMLQHKLYRCKLVVDKPDTGRCYTPTISRARIHELAEQMPDAKILGGNLNGHLLIHLPFIPMENLTLKFLDEHLDIWLEQDSLVPELYLIGGYYPQKDATETFDIMRHNSKIYVYGIEPKTDMPVYHITDDKLIRIKGGEIAAPATKIIDDTIAEKIRDALNTEPLYFI